MREGKLEPPPETIVAAGLASALISVATIRCLIRCGIIANKDAATIFQSALDELTQHGSPLPDAVRAAAIGNILAAAGDFGLRAARDD
jgi:hypothetical protein